MPMRAVVPFGRVLEVNELADAGAAGQHRGERGLRVGVSVRLHGASDFEPVPVFCAVSSRIER